MTIFEFVVIMQVRNTVLSSLRTRMEGSERDGETLNSEKSFVRRLFLSERQGRIRYGGQEP